MISEFYVRALELPVRVFGTKHAQKDWGVNFLAVRILKAKNILLFSPTTIERSLFARTFSLKTNHEHLPLL